MNEEQRKDMQGPNSEYYEDEISLVDLWIVLMRRKWVVVGFTVAFVLAGLAFWSTKSVEERYVTSIEIGRVINEQGAIERIETRKAVETRLRNSILPTLRNKVAKEFEKNPNELPKVEIKVLEEEGTGDFVFLETTANPKDKKLVDALHNGIVDRLSKVHAKMYNTYKKQFSIKLSRMKIELRKLKDKNLLRLKELKAENELAEAKNTLEEKKEAFPIQQQKQKDELEKKKDALQEAKLAFKVKKQNLEHKIRQASDKVESLKQTRERLKARLDRISVERKLNSDQIDDVRKWLKNARESQQSLYKSIEADSNIALAALMLGDQAESARKELAELRHRISIELPEQRSKIEADLEENNRKILAAQENVQELKSELAKLKEDHAQDIRERERNIAQLKETIEKAASDHQRTIEEAKRKIERSKMELKQLYSEHERNVEREENEIDLFATNGDRMEETRATASAVPAKTIGRGGMMIGALSLVLGLMVGLFGAFFSEFHARAKEMVRKREE